VLVLASWGIADDYEATFQEPKTNDPQLSVVLSGVLNLYGYALKDQCSILEIQAACRESPDALPGIVGNTHLLL
jgi:hypothetical protein